MEGLIPYVYRAIRRRRARRHYRCLSSGSALIRVVTTPKFLTPPPEQNARHRRHRSMEGLSGELSPEAFPERRRLGKRSSFVFACVAGA